MKFSIIKWSVRIFAILVLAFGLPFYFGYGNPLPFLNSKYSNWDNLWLTVFPVMFIGLLVGLRFPKVGGYLTTVSVFIGLIAGFVIEKELVSHMLIPLFAGVLYLVVGYWRPKQ